MFKPLLVGACMSLAYADECSTIKTLYNSRGCCSATRTTDPGSSIVFLSHALDTTGSTFWNSIRLGASNILSQTPFTMKWYDTAYNASLHADLIVQHCAENTVIVTSVPYAVNSTEGVGIDRVLNWCISNNGKVVTMNTDTYTNSRVYGYAGSTNFEIGKTCARILLSDTHDIQTGRAPLSEELTLKLNATSVVYVYMSDDELANAGIRARRQGFMQMLTEFNIVTVSVTSLDALHDIEQDAIVVALGVGATFRVLNANITAAANVMNCGDDQIQNIRFAGQVCNLQGANAASTALLALEYEWPTVKGNGAVNIDATAFLSRKTCATEPDVIFKTAVSKKVHLVAFSGGGMRAASTQHAIMTYGFMGNRLKIQHLTGYSGGGWSIKLFRQHNRWLNPLEMSCVLHKMRDRMIAGRTKCVLDDVSFFSPFILDKLICDKLPFLQKGELAWIYRHSCNWEGIVHAMFDEYNEPIEEADRSHIAKMTIQVCFTGRVAPEPMLDMSTPTYPHRFTRRDYISPTNYPYTNWDSGLVELRGKKQCLLTIPGAADNFTPRNVDCLDALAGTSAAAGMVVAENECGIAQPMNKVAHFLGIEDIDPNAPVYDTIQSVASEFVCGGSRIQQLAPSFYIEGDVSYSKKVGFCIAEDFHDSDDAYRYTLEEAKRMCNDAANANECGGITCRDYAPACKLMKTKQTKYSIYTQQEEYDSSDPTGSSPYTCYTKKGVNAHFAQTVDGGFCDICGLRRGLEGMYDQLLADPTAGLTAETPITIIHIVDGSNDWEKCIASVRDKPKMWQCGYQHLSGDCATNDEVSGASKLAFSQDIPKVTEEEDWQDKMFIRVYEGTICENFGALSGRMYRMLYIYECHAERPKTMMPPYDTDNFEKFVEYSSDIGKSVYASPIVKGFFDSLPDAE